MEIRLACEIQVDSIVDGNGIRTVIWTQGCPHKCLGCHNQHTHDFTKGILSTTEKVIDQINNLIIQDGITFSGGEPFSQAKACCEIAKAAKSRGLNIWSYSGYTFEELLELGKTNLDIFEFLNNIDVLVDGKFMLDLKSYDVLFRGSSNQRIINVKRSLKTNKACLIGKYKAKKEISKKKKGCIFI